MYARRTVTKAAPEQAEKAKEVVENSLIPNAKQLPGFAGGYWLIDRATGEALTFTFFDTKENLEASAGHQGAGEERQDDHCEDRDHREDDPRQPHRPAADRCE